jgi:hypothetical protein
VSIDPLRPASRLAIAGDWHANSDHAVDAVEHCARQGSDAIVHLGDFGWSFGPEFVGPLQSALADVGMPLLFVDGNHEHHPKLRRFPILSNGLRRISDNIWHMPRGFRWSWYGARFLACGGAYSVDRPWRIPGVSWWPEESITEDDVAACGTDPVDILFAHDCPYGVTIPGLTKTAHLWPPVEIIRSDDNRRRLRRIVDNVQPRWIWHGHYHIRYRRKVDLGYGPVHVTGLDREGDLRRNIAFVEVADFAAAPTPDASTNVDHRTIRA